MDFSRIRIGDILVSHKVVNKGQIIMALEMQKKHPDKKLGEIMVQSGHITQQNLEDALAVQNIPPATNWLDVDAPYVEIPNEEEEKTDIDIVLEVELIYGEGLSNNYFFIGVAEHHRPGETKESLAQRATARLYEIILEKINEKSLDK